MSADQIDTPATLLERSASQLYIPPGVLSVERIAAFLEVARNPAVRDALLVCLRVTGNATSLQQLVDEIFTTLPLGLRSELSDSVWRKWKDLLDQQQPLFNLLDTEEALDPQPRPIRCWLGGVITPSQCMDLIGEELSSPERGKMLSKVLHDGGYSSAATTTSTFDVEDGEHCATTLGVPQHVELSTTTSNPAAAGIDSLRSITGVRLSYLNKSLQPVVSTLSNLGHRTFTLSSTSELIPYLPSRSYLQHMMTTASTDVKNQRYYQWLLDLSKGQTDPAPNVVWTGPGLDTLLIGSRIAVGGASLGPPSSLLHVDRVISADFLEAEGAFVAMVEGRFAYGDKEMSTLPADCGAPSECAEPSPCHTSPNEGSLHGPQGWAEPRNRDPFDPADDESSSQNSSEEDRRSQPYSSMYISHTLKRRYYCVYGSSAPGARVVRIEGVTSLQGPGLEALLGDGISPSDSSDCGANDSEEEGEGSPGIARREFEDEWAPRSPSSSLSCGDSESITEDSTEDQGLRNKLLIDQQPLAVLLISSLVAVVRGTNALLAVVTGGREGSSAFRSITVDYVSAGLAKDDKDITDADGRPLYHDNAASITAFSYAATSRTLFSGDSYGVVAAWVLPSSMQDLGAPEIQIKPAAQFTSLGEGKRTTVSSLYAAPSGRHVAVATHDALFLVGTTQVLGPPEEQKLYIRCQLDNLWGTYARYWVQFMMGGEGIVILRAIVHTGTCKGADPLLGIGELEYFPTDGDEVTSISEEVTATVRQALQAPGLVNGKENKVQLSSWLHTDLDSWSQRWSSFPRMSSHMGFSSSTLSSPDTTYETEESIDADASIEFESILSSHNFGGGTAEQSFGPVRYANELQNGEAHENFLLALFGHPSSESFQENELVLCCWAAAATQYTPLGLLAAALDAAEPNNEDAFLVDVSNVERLVGQRPLCELLEVVDEDELEQFRDYAYWEDTTIPTSTEKIVRPKPGSEGVLSWMFRTESDRLGGNFWLDERKGHNALATLFLKNCSNKSIAVEHAWTPYLRYQGPYHLRHATRGLRALTTNVRKIDETANLRGRLGLPRQIGLVSGLQEIYCRRVGLRGRIPAELSELSNLRVLSMGNNFLCGELPASLTRLRNLQRIVLHQNKLCGRVPNGFSTLGCIVNLAGNRRLELGPDVPQSEREALMAFYRDSNGCDWVNHKAWGSSSPVSSWYKIGCLDSHVHSIVMSSNNLRGVISPGVGGLTRLRMVELATMPFLTGSLPTELCALITLRRLCICRCGLSGPIPQQIGLLVGLEELQLFGNRHTGSIPDSIGCLVNLKLLSLGEYSGGNPFEHGPIPSCISRLARLEALFLSQCNLQGVLPSWMGNLAELRQLDLQSNNLTGSLPAEWTKLVHLGYLNLKSNQMLGAGSRLPISTIATMRRLNRLSLMDTSFVLPRNSESELKSLFPRCKIWIGPSAR